MHAVTEMLLYECAHDGPRVAVPHPEVQIVARIAGTAEGGLDIHAMGVRQTVHRKNLRAGQRSVTARLRIGTVSAVLGVTAPELEDRIIALEDLWGASATATLRDRLASARDTRAIAAILRDAIEEKLQSTSRQQEQATLAVNAAQRLVSGNVSMVANELGVSERHLRRVFRETVGVSPKAYAKLSRFHRAIDAAHTGSGWAHIAAAAGYYDQAHLIAEFKAIAGVTPRTLLAELRAGALPR